MGLFAVRVPGRSLNGRRQALTKRGINIGRVFFRHMAFFAGSTSGKSIGVCTALFMKFVKRN
jgi:hypothetical protein